MLNKYYLNGPVPTGKQYFTHQMSKPTVIVEMMIQFKNLIANILKMNIRNYPMLPSDEFLGRILRPQCPQLSCIGKYEEDEENARNISYYWFSMGCFMQKGSYYLFHIEQSKFCMAALWETWTIQSGIANNALSCCHTKRTGACGPPG